MHNVPSAKSWINHSAQAIARALLLSLALHFAFLLIFQPATEISRPRTVVIETRLQSIGKPPPPAPSLPKPAKIHTQALTDVFTTPAEPTTPTPTPTHEIEDVVVPPIAAVHVAPVTTNISLNVPAPTEATVTLPPPQALNLPSLPIDIDPNWYFARQVDTQPKAIGKIEPTYPEEAKRSNLEGSLKLMLKIDDLGRVQSAEVIDAVPPGVFDEAALAAFKEARFQPAIREGRAVRYQAYMRVEFKLKD